MNIDVKNNKIYFNNDDKSFANITVSQNSVHLELIKVDCQYRGLSLGSQMLITIIDYIKKHYQLIEKITVSPLPLDRTSLGLDQLINFYTKFKFKKSYQKSFHNPYLMERYI